MIIIFWGGFEVLILLVILVAIIAGAAEFVANILGFLCILFCIKVFIQDIRYGAVKNHNSIFFTVGFLIVDFIRIITFFWYSLFVCDSNVKFYWWKIFG